MIIRLSEKLYATCGGELLEGTDDIRAMLLKQFQNNTAYRKGDPELSLLLDNLVINNLIRRETTCIRQLIDAFHVCCRIFIAMTGVYIFRQVFP